MLTHGRDGRRRLRPGALLTAAAAAVALLGVPAASADTAPVSGSTPTTVSTDVLPTVQVNGVVWAQVVVGNRVYATGSFTRARPAGAAPGTREVARANLLAYDLTTGALVTAFKPALNAQGLAIAASTDGKTIFVAGDFTSVSGVARHRIAALDAATGAVRPGFTTGLNARARALAVSGNTVYVGGIFTTAGRVARTRLAALSATNGAVLAWAPKADAEVWAITVPPGSGKVVVGGRFKTLNGVAAYGMGALSGTGALRPWPVNTVIRNAGSTAAITSLRSDATQVYGTGYTFGQPVQGNFEGSFAASVSTGGLVWVNGCRGDTYDNHPAGAVLYTVSHAHDCSMVGGLPQTKPSTFQRAMASTTAPAANGAVNSHGVFQGRRAPELLHWLPGLDVGSYTGQNQAAWTVTGNARYIVLGGEFPKVNGVAQQGLVRFAVRGVAPDKDGPRGYAELKPTLAAVTGGVRVSWKAAWDRDNRRMTFEVLRGEPIGTAVVVARRTADTNWWTRPAMAFTDTTAPAGTVTYRVRASDPLGNTMTSQPVAIRR